MNLDVTEGMKESWRKLDIDWIYQANHKMKRETQQRRRDNTENTQYTIELDSIYLLPRKVTVESKTTFSVQNIK